LTNPINTGRTTMMTMIMVGKVHRSPIFQQGTRLEESLVLPPQGFQVTFRKAR
jgi:hypothetical protein